MADSVMATGCGGYGFGQFFHSIFPNWVRDWDFNIACLELLTVGAAVKLWVKHLHNK